MSAVTAVRELTDDELRAYHTANLVAFDRMWYFADGLFSVIPVAAPGLGTFAVDRSWRLYMDPAVLVGDQVWGPQKTATALLHETSHLLRDHAGRADALPQPLSQIAWNYAGDAEINDDLLDAGLVFPIDPVTPEALGQPRGGLGEDYYAALMRDQDAAGGAGGQQSGGGGSHGADGAESGEDGPGCGSGSGCDPVPGELGAADVIGGRRGIDPATADGIRQAVAEAVASAVASGRGTVPAGVRRWADAVLAPPVVPWNRVLRVAIRRVIAEAAGRTDYSLVRPSRRSRDVLFPGLRGPKITVAVVVDTSGSMSPADLAAALSEIKGVLRTSGVARERLVVLTVDAAASAPQRVSRVEDIALIGGGGTDMRIGIAAAEALRPVPDVVIVCSDGLTPWPETAGRAQLICVVIGNAGLAQCTPEFAVTVTVPSGAGQRLSRAA